MQRAERKRNLPKSRKGRTEESPSEEREVGNMLDLLKECEGAKRIGISGHIRPDGDCVGACLGLQLYLQKNLPDVQVQVYLEQPEEIFKDIKGFREINSEFPEAPAFDVYFAVDCGKDRIGAAEKYFDSAKKTINIDHHMSNVNGTAQVNHVRPEIGSACEVLYDLMDKEKMDADIALALYVGMVHDTGVFQYSNTTPDTMRKAAALMEYGFAFHKIIEETFYKKTYLQTQIMGRVMEECTLALEGACAIGMVSDATMKELGLKAYDLDGIVNQMRNITGVHCGIFLYEITPGEFKISLRSDEAVNVATVAEYFGGGGHMRASGFTMKGTAKECVDKLLIEIQKQLS